MGTTKSILDSIRRIVRGLRIASRAAEKELGVSAAQLFVLQKIREGRVLSINQLAELTYTDQSSVSVVVSRLAERGLVSRTPSPEDGRRLEIRLSEAGQRLIRSAQGSEQERLVSALAGMSAAEREQLAALLIRFTSLAGLADEAPGLFFEDEAKS